VNRFLAAKAYLIRNFIGPSRRSFGGLFLPHVCGAGHMVSRVLLRRLKVEFAFWLL
jgi:hypothetical protein